MRNVSEIFGKRLQAEKEAVLFIGSPGSDVIELLPPGAVTGEIYSYLQRGPGYFQIKPDPGGQFKYVADNERVEVVEEDTPDESSIINNALSSVGSFYKNWTTWGKKNAGFVATGFEESIEGLGTNTDKYIRYGLIGGGIYLAIQILKLIRENG
jgi:hypothetical protein